MINDYVKSEEYCRAIWLGSVFFRAVIETGRKIQFSYVISVIKVVILLVVVIIETCWL